MNVVRPVSFVGIQFCQYWKDVFRANRKGVHWYHVFVEGWGILPFVVSERCPKSVCQELTFMGGLGNDIANSILKCGNLILETASALHMSIKSLWVGRSPFR